MWKGTVAAVAVLVALAACTNDGTGDDATPGGSTPSAIASVAPPPGRSSPFCQAMIELDGSLPDDPSVDVSDQILAAYRAALPDVPAEIADAFAAVIDALEHGTVATLPAVATTTATASTSATTATVAGSDAPASSLPPGATSTAPPDTFYEEGYLPDDSPAARVSAYIDFVCRGIQNNPGPPATQPPTPPTTDEAG